MIYIYIYLFIYLGAFAATKLNGPHETKPPAFFLICVMICVQSRDRKRLSGDRKRLSGDRKRSIQ